MTGINQSIVSDLLLATAAVGRLHVVSHVHFYVPVIRTHALHTQSEPTGSAVQSLFIMYPRTSVIMLSRIALTVGTATDWHEVIQAVCSARVIRRAYRIRRSGRLHKEHRWHQRVSALSGARHRAHQKRDQPQYVPHRDGVRAQW